MGNMPLLKCQKIVTPEDLMEIHEIALFIILPTFHQSKHMTYLPRLQVLQTRKRRLSSTLFIT